jgi:glutamyl-tRNA reductase
MSGRGCRPAEQNQFAGQPLPLFCISITHRQAPVEVRREFAFNEAEQEQFLRAIMDCGAAGTVLVSTCNRVEAYVSSDIALLETAELLFSKGSRALCRTLRKFCREYRGADEVRHLFSVCAGLDSMVVGEDEILGQVREAYKRAEAAGCTDFYINTIFQQAFACAKQVKTDTCLSKTSVSIATLTASEIAHWSEEPKRVLLIGITGQMGGLIAKDLASQKNVQIYATMRLHRASETGGAFGCAVQAQGTGLHGILGNGVEVVSYEERYRYLDRADVVVSATKSPHYTLTYESCRQHMQTEKPRLFVDIAVPNDIDPDIGLLPGAVVKGIDHFQGIARENNARKAAGVLQAEELIAAHLQETLKTLEFHTFLPRLSAMNGLMEQLSAKQLFFALKDVATDEELAALLHMSEKLLEEEL